MKKNKRKGAQSYRNGIRFWSKNDERISLHEFYDKDGNMHAVAYYGNNIPSLFFKEDLSMYDCYEKAHNISLAITILLVFVYIITCNFSFLIKVFLGMHMITVAAKVSKLFADIIKYKYSNGGKDIRRFHAAEHKAVNAYEKNNEIPTYDQIKSASMYSAQCTSRNGVISLLQCVVGIIVILCYATSAPFWKLFLYVFFIQFITRLFFIFSKLDVWLFQWIYVLEPTERELKLAYEGLNNLKKAEEHDKDLTKIECMEDYFDLLFCSK